MASWETQLRPEMQHSLPVAESCRRLSAPPPERAILRYAIDRGARGGLILNVCKLRCSETLAVHDAVGKGSAHP
jgi:hypothetical protein